MEANTSGQFGQQLGPSDRWPNPSPNTGRCIYGFVLFLVAIVMLLLYFLYAMTAREVQQSIGLTYFERKYWSIALPTNILVSLLVLTACLYPSINYLSTPSLNHCNTIFDSNTTQPLVNTSQDITSK
ncbi:unnamed protein product, partial [Medioppia subpectinata]